MRAGAITVVIVGLASFVLTRLDTQVTTPIGSMGAGRGRFPVVEIAGLGSDGSGFGPLTTQLRHEGVTVIDFKPDVAGIQPLTWKASSPDVHIPQLATQTVAPAIDDAVRRAGFDPAHQVIDVVAHSVGGLIMRYLMEKTGAPPTPTDTLSWAARVDDLVMVATPNHGTRIGFLEATLGPGHSDWDGIAADMAPHSSFLTLLGTTEPPGEVYTTIGWRPVAVALATQRPPRLRRRRAGRVADPGGRSALLVPPDSRTPGGRRKDHRPDRQGHVAKHRLTTHQNNRSAKISGSCTPSTGCRRPPWCTGCRSPPA